MGVHVGELPAQIGIFTRLQSAVFNLKKYLVIIF
jgi:hypothetical protein